jgi:hypothetical protein
MKIYKNLLTKTYHQFAALIENVHVEKYKWMQLASK